MGSLRGCVLILFVCFCLGASPPSLLAETCGFTDEIRAPEGMSDREFGGLVALDGDTLVTTVTSSEVNGDPRTIYIYRDIGSAWELEEILRTPNPDDPGLFAWRFALEGNRLIVPSVLEGSVEGQAAGVVRYYERNEGAWQLRQTLNWDELPGGPYGRFGEQVSLRGDWLAIGTLIPNPSRVLLFNYRGGQWELVDQVSYEEETGETFFGFGLSAISMEGNLLSVAGILDPWAPAVPANMALYEFDGDRWVFQTLLPDPLNPPDGAGLVGPLEIEISGGQIAHLGQPGIHLWTEGAQGWEFELIENPYLGVLADNEARFKRLEFERGRLIVGQSATSSFSCNDGAIVDVHPTTPERLMTRHKVETPAAFCEVGRNLSLSRGRTAVSMLVDTGADSVEGLIRIYECTVSRGDDDCGTSGLYVNAGVLGCMPRDYLQPRTGRVPLRR